MDRKTWLLERTARGTALLLGAALFVGSAAHAQGDPEQRQVNTQNPGKRWQEVAQAREARSARLAERLPGGFGGFSIEENGDVVVFLQDTTHAAAARAAVAPLLRDRGRSRRSRGPAVPNIVVRRGEFGFGQLSGWRDQLTDPLMDIEGVEVVDLDERTNRIVVGISSDAARAGAEQKAKELGAPAAALRFEKTAPFAPDIRYLDEGSPARFFASLQGYNRPVRGGMLVSFENAEAGRAASCTLGVVAKIGGEATATHFLTNSHCTGINREVGRAKYYQETIVPDRYIGYESRDPGYTACGFMYTYKCRQSDAAAGRLDTAAGVTAGTLEFGSIARPLAGGSLTIDPNNPRFRISASGDVPWVGEYVDKVGAETGWTYGKLVQECVTVDLGSYRFYCQDLATYGRASGDSGAPVFLWNEDDTASFVGLHVGFNGDYAVYSPLFNIREDLGVQIQVH
jgi:hypothetical protein